MQGIDFVFSLAVLVISVIVHEVSHGYMALALGDHTAKRAGRLTLNPISHIDPMGSIVLPLLLALAGAPVFGWAKPVPYNPYNLRAGKWGPALVALAGPVSNFILACIFAFVLRVFVPMGLVSGASIAIVVRIILVNILLGTFNLIPIPPIDGSKILFALLPFRWSGVQHFMERNQWILLFILIFFLWSSIYPVIFTIFDFLVGPVGSHLLYM